MYSGCSFTDPDDFSEEDQSNAIDGGDDKVSYETFGEESCGFGDMFGSGSWDGEESVDEGDNDEDSCW